MLARLHNAAATALLFGLLAAGAAHADIYTWVDASGVLNVSNLNPPAGATVTSVVKSVAPALPADNTTPEQAAAMQALSWRILQLQAQVADAQRPVAPAIVNNVYVSPSPAPATVQYAQLGYTYDTPPQATPGCDLRQREGASAGYQCGHVPSGYERYPQGRCLVK